MSDKRCGNCAYFYPDWGFHHFGKYGDCTITLPPWVDVNKEKTSVYADEQCDLHKPEKTEEQT